MVVSEERKTLLKTLMEIHFKNNGICYTLKYIIFIDEKSVKQIKMMLIFKKSGKWEFPQTILSRYILIAHHSLPLSHVANNMATNEMWKNPNSSISIWIYVKF